ncbi:hypothetical protein NE237_028079 [Protea cynaroides]|uniref:Pectinesterase catalytic domain-containing protein n=1 Tax=Protea cynaroides TaxID=273540 RepID=A0A9Q0GNN1_9MAGN|nr:hypothetical protein NE237_028079 [Protea cynaroides]
MPGNDLKSERTDLKSENQTRGSTYFQCRAIKTSQVFLTLATAVEGKKFLARAMKFENVADPEDHQAVAMRVTGDKAAFFDCKMEMKKTHASPNGLRHLSRRRM